MGKSTLDAKCNECQMVYNVAEKYNEHSIEVHMLFIDFKQAFYSEIQHKDMEKNTGIGEDSKINSDDNGESTSESLY